MLNLTRMKLIVASYVLLILPLWAQPADNPSLINITTLEQLDAIRYDMDGNGIPDTYSTNEQKAAYRTTFSLLDGANNICSGGCEGYELMNNLDFNDEDTDMAGNQLSKWAKECMGDDCVTGTQVGGTNGNIGWESIYYFYGDEDGDEDDIIEEFFSARFHGNEYTISNLYVNRRRLRTTYVGLFGRIEEATLDSLKLRDIEVKVENASENFYAGLHAYAGGLVGYVGFVNDASSSSITSCSVTGDLEASSISGSAYGGGLVGYAGTIANPSHSSSISITDCYATGDVTATTPFSHGGGLVGYIGPIDSFTSGSTSASITSCYATGDVTATVFVGGLVGESHNSSMMASYATGDVTASGQTGNVGGFVGYSSSSSITACYATGFVSAIDIREGRTLFI